MQFTYETENLLHRRRFILNKNEYFSTLAKKSQPFTSSPSPTFH